MKRFTYYNPSKVLFGRGQIEELSRDCPPDAAERILLVTDPDSARLSGALDRVNEQLADREILLFDRVMENPSYEIVDEGAKLAADQGIDLVIGIGGGSALDAAKGIALASQQPKSIRSYVEGEPLAELPLPIIAIPTTAGTGSEVTPFAVFSDHKKEIKVGYESDHIFPTLAIVDPQFCDSLPEKLVISTGLDALTHAIEAYLSTHNNPMADTLALSALELVVGNLGQAAQKRGPALDAMCYAATIAGLAIAQKSTILLHILAYPLTHSHHIQHGLANALLLPAVLDFLKQKGDCAERVKLINLAFERVGGVGSFLKELGITPSLRQYGVDPSRFERFAEQTLLKGDITITPARVDKAVLIEIYRAAL